MALAALIILSVNLEVCLWMEADGTDVGGFSADDDVAAVAAFPNADTSLAEHLGGLDVAQQGTVALLVVLLDGRYATELLGQFMEALLVGPPSAACSRFSATVPSPPRWRNHSLACSFSFSAVFRKRAAICS